MPVGCYDRLVQFQRAGKRDNGLQSVKDAFADLGPQVPARFAAGVGKERFASAANAATAPAVFWFRYCPELQDLGTDDRLVEDGRAFQILSVRWDGRLNSEVEVAVVRDGGRL